MPIQISWQGATLGANTFTGAQVAPSLALGGATIGSNALAVTGSMALGGGAITYSGSMTGNMSIAMSGLGINWAAARTISMSSLGNIGFAATDTGTATNDTAFSRISAGIIGVGTGAQGSVAGSLSAATITTTGLSNMGSIQLTAAATVFWNGRGAYSMPADGVLLMQNYAGTSFSRLQFGGTTSSFPAIKRNATALNFRLADDSADAPITAAAGTFSGTVTGTNIYVTGYVGAANKGLIGFPTATDGLFQFTLNDGTTGYSLLASADTMTLRNRANSAAGALVAGAGTFSGALSVDGSLTTYNNFNLGSSRIVGWGNGSIGTIDSAFSRISAGIIGVGTGAAGNIAGGLQAATLALGGATIGSNALAVTGTAAVTGSGSFSGGLSVGTTGVTAAGDVGVTGKIYAIGATQLLLQGGDGIALFRNSAGTDFSRLMFGGTTSSYPALKRSGSALQMRLADDSGNAYFQAASYYMNYNSFITDSSDGVIKLSNNAGTDFSLLQFGGTTTSFPAWQRVGSGFFAKLADNSANTFVAMNQLLVTDGITAPVATVGFAKLYVDTADGDLKVIFGDGIIKTLATDT